MANPARNFDSLTYANELREAGVPEKQANLQAKALFRLVEEQLLNKQDLEQVEFKLGAEIKELEVKLGKVESKVESLESKLISNINETELRLKAEIKDSELRLFVRLISAMALIGGVLKFLPTLHF